MRGASRQARDAATPHVTTTAAPHWSLRSAERQKWVSVLFALRQGKRTVSARARTLRGVPAALGTFTHYSHSGVGGHGVVEGAGVMEEARQGPARANHAIPCDFLKRPSRPAGVCFESGALEARSAGAPRSHFVMYKVEKTKTKDNPECFRADGRIFSLAAQTGRPTGGDRGCRGRRAMVKKALSWSKPRRLSWDGSNGKGALGMGSNGTGLTGKGLFRATAGAAGPPYILNSA